MTYLKSKKLIEILIETLSLNNKVMINKMNNNNNNNNLKICHRCKEEKSILDFYTYTNRTSKSICKTCENTNISKSELYTCELCGMNIRRKNKKKT